MGLYIILTIPPLLLGLWAQWRVKSAYEKWSRCANARNLTGAQAAAEMLRRENVNDVRIEQVGGTLSDYYDPSAKVLRLSSGVYGAASVAALGIACHEAGHALQHARGYAYLGLRSALVMPAKFGSYLAIPLIMFGMLIGALGLAKLGVIIFGAVVLFQLVTLPVEFDASRRAKAALVNNGVINAPERAGVNEVLDAAAMTYVAAAVAAISQLLYYALILAGNRRR
ncbi:zinc metallopeptidase [Planctomycetales bacterium]|nr:zinc metallopeptidase [Planctomycetales bacterium]